MNEPSCCHQSKKRSGFREPLWIILFLVVGLYLLNLVLLSFGIKILDPVFNKFFSYLARTWWAILLGLFVGGLVETLLPEELMARLFNQGKKSILFSAALGFLASACSHGILAIAVSLYKKGASTSSVLTFLLAAPWANLAITLLLFSLFGARALFIVGGALFIAIVSGFIFSILEKRGIIEGRKEAALTEKINWVWPGLRITFARTFQSAYGLIKMVVWWVILGFLIASFLGTYLPEEIFHQFFGPTILGMMATLLLASVIEVCSEGSAPMAFELFEKTKAFGNAFVFLQAGVITDFTEIGIIWTNIGKRAALALVIVTVPLVLFLGFLFNQLLW